MLRLAPPGRLKGRRPAPALRRAGLTVAVLVAVVAAGGGHYTVQPGDSLSSIAGRFDVSPAALAAVNALADPDSIRTGQSLLIPGQDGPTRHVVQAGENLAQIAARYGVSRAALAEANGIDDPDLVHAGVTLTVPVDAGEAAPVEGPLPPQGASNPTVRAEVGRLLEQTARAYGWRPEVPKALAMQESGWNNAAVSNRGAVGIMQVLPSTAEWLSTYIVKRPLDLHEPADNIAAGIAYLDYLYRRFDRNLELALGAYYQGPRSVQDNGLGEDTARYVANVLALRERF